MPKARVGLAVGLSAALFGCQTYTPRPLDLAAHSEAFLARTPEDEGIAAFAARLDSEGGGSRPEYGLADGLSLREAEAVALFFNPDLRVARLRAGVALAGARYAGLWEDPDLGVDAERILDSVDEPWVLGASLGFTLPISGRLAVEEARAKAEHRAELRRVLAEEWATRVALRSAWLEWSAQQRRAALTRQLLESVESIVGVVSRLEEAGGLSRMEARLFRIELATRRNDLRAIESRARELELTLRALMGLTPSAPVALVPSAVVATEPPPVADLNTAMESRNPTLAALRAEYEVAEESLRLEIRRQYPDITIAPGFGAEEGDSRVLLGVSLPIPLWNRNQRGIAEASARRELTRAEFESEFERLAGRLAAAYARHEAAAARRAALESEIVPLVEEQHAEAHRVAELGEVDTLLLLETLTRLYETKTALLDARLAESSAALRIDELIGPPPEPAPPPATNPATPEGAAP